MNIVFVSSACETLAIEYLSAALKQAGHSCELCFDPQLFDDTFLKYPTLSRLFDHTEIIMDELCSYQPDLVAVSVVSDNFPWASRLSQRIKKELDVPIVFASALTKQRVLKVLDKAIEVYKNRTQRISTSKLKEEK